MITFEEGFIETIEKSPELKYTDTDSIYSAFKTDVNKYHKDNWSELIDQAIYLATKINDNINDTMVNYFSERAGLDPSFQTLYFKTEMVALRMLQYDIKKTYSLSYIYDEGKYLSDPEIKNTGGHIKKSGTPDISKQLLKDIVTTMLKKEITDINELASVIFKNILDDYTLRYKNAYESYNIPYFGIPYKYGFTKKATKWVLGAKFFNLFFHDELRPGVSMYAVYISYNASKLKKLIDDKGETSNFKLSNPEVDNTFDMLSIPIETSDKFLETYKETIQYLYNTIDFRLSYDKNYNFCIQKKIDPYKKFFT
jgi:hypothetical protein